jgi:hypothetical protein
MQGKVVGGKLSTACRAGPVATRPTSRAGFEPGPLFLLAKPADVRHRG